MIVEQFPVGPLQCNCIILADQPGGQAIVIDPGDEPARIFAALEKHHLRLAAAVATHAHIDHVGGLAALKQLTGAPAMMHEDDVPLYEQMALQAAWLGVPAPAITTVDSYLRDKQALDFGACALRVMHTPGHSPGSVSFLLDQAVPIVFSGDTLFAGSIGRTDLWGGSFTALMASIQKRLLSLPDDIEVVPGHGPSTSIGEERISNPFLQDVKD